MTDAFPEDAYPELDDAAIRRLLTGTRTWAIVGLSDNTERPAYGVAAFLKSVGKRIVPVHPKTVPVHGEPGYATLAEIPFPVDVVDVFRRSEAAGQFADEAVAIGARAVWLQLGVFADPDSVSRAREAGLDVVEQRCPAIELPRLSSR